MIEQKYTPYLTQIGDKVKFFREKQRYTVRAVSNRYVVATKPFNLQKTVFYTIIDFKEKMRGPEDLIFGLGAETDIECFEILVRILDGETELSRRRSIKLDLEYIQGSEDKEYVWHHETGELTVDKLISRNK